MFESFELIIQAKSRMTKAKVEKKTGSVVVQEVFSVMDSANPEDVFIADHSEGTFSLEKLRSKRDELQATAIIPPAGVDTQPRNAELRKIALEIVERELNSKAA